MLIVECESRFKGGSPGRDVELVLCPREDRGCQRAQKTSLDRSKIQTNENPWQLGLKPEETALPVSGAKL
jgi:hypothetical protein